MIPQLNYQRAPITNAAMKVFVTGNSLTVGQAASDGNHSWPEVFRNLAPMAGTGIVISKSAIGGQTIQQMRTAAPAALDAFFVVGKLNVIFAWEMSAEINNNGYDAAAAHVQWDLYCRERRAAAAAAGAALRIVTVTMIPGASAPDQTAANARCAAIAAGNVLLRKHFRDYSDVLMDLGAEEPWASMFAANDWSDAAFAAQPFYQHSDGTAMDKVHLGNSGYARIAQIAARTLLRIRK